MSGTTLRPHAASPEPADGDLRETLARERAARAEAELLNEIALSAAGEDDLGRILEVALRSLGRVVRFTGASIALLEPAGLRVRAAVGPRANRILRQLLRPDDSLRRRAIHTREPVVSGDLAGDAASGPEGDGGGVRSYLAVPLVWRDEAIGLLEVDSPERDRFTARDVELTTKVAVAVSGPIELARRYAAEVLALEAEQRARREAEEAERSKDESLALLDMLLANAPTGIGFWDRDLRFVRINDALASINGLRPEQHLGRTLDEILPGLPEEVAEDFREVMRSGVPIVDREVVGETPAAPGEQRHWLASYYPVPGRDGAPLGVGGIVTEITDRKRADREREVLAAQREELFRRESHARAVA